jgi:HD-GYP domain-containing protein (c-di-GMP phosphodiesterase class II)
VRTEIRLSEVVAALSHALDITEGQPIGHAERCCRIGMRIGEAIGLPAQSRSALFYALLLKDAGCSSTASRVAALFENDDQRVKVDLKTTDLQRPLEAIRYAARNAAPGRNLLMRARRFALVALKGSRREITQLRCERGADIARQIGLSEETAQAILHLDEHWDGAGDPGRIHGEDIPILGRILCLSQSAEIAWQRGGPDAVVEVARQRRGTWFDPRLVDVLVALRADSAFWARVRLTDVSDLEPEDRAEVADDARLDHIAEAFASVIDAKSPFTSAHSQGVADIAGQVARQLDLPAAELRDLRRAGLLHDIGKLGVSSRILDKAGPLTDAEWAAMRRHPEMTQRILEHVSAFGPLAETAAAHHERLDGRGYHRGVHADQLPLAARILAVADVAEALSADRPYRSAMAPDEVLALMREEVGSHFCPVAYEALEGAMSARPC